MTVLNPFSVSLEKHPFMTMPDKPVFEINEYRIYKYSKEHYVHTFKNIVFAERVGANKELINNIINNTPPEDQTQRYFEYERGKEAIAEGIEAAKKLNFKIN